MVGRKRRSELSFPHIGYVWDRYKYASSTRDAVICWRVHYLGKVKVVSTGIRVFKGEWDNRHQQVINRPDAAIINQQLELLIHDIKEVVLEMWKDGHIDICAIESKLLNKRKPNQTFLDFCEERAKIRKYGKAADSQERYERFLKFLNTWGNIKTFYDLTEAKVVELDRYLKSKNDMKAKSRWNNYHRFLNSFILDAQKEGLVTINPYDKVKIDHGDDSEGISKHLTPEEFDQLKAAKMPSERLERVKDLFIFQTYTCLAYRDLRVFNPKRIEEIDGEPTYRGRRGKTKIEFVIPMMPPALEILKKYKGKLPMLSNVKYNDYLKEVSKEAGLHHPITTHWARHTGATYYLNRGELPIEIVSRMLGHATIKETERTYAYRQPKTVVKALKEIKNKI